MKKLSPLLFLAVAACGDDDTPSAEEVAEACSDDFLLQYDVDALDVRYEATVDAADIYGIDPGAAVDLDAEAEVCLDYKASYEARQHNYESLELAVAAEADSDALNTGAARVDRGLRWVTYEVPAGQDGYFAITPGWVTFIALENGGNGEWNVDNNRDVYVGADYIETLDDDHGWRVSVAYPF